MSKFRFQVQHRLSHFFAAFNLSEIYSAELIVDFIGWYFFYFATLITLPPGFVNSIFPVIVLLIFWWRLLNKINAKLEIPAEILLALLLILYFFEALWIKVIFSSNSAYSGTATAPGVFTTILYTPFPATITLILSLLLVRRRQSGKMILFFLIIFSFLGFVLWNTQNVYYWWIFQIVLTLILLRRTAWVEELTKAECWIYLIIFINLFELIVNAGFLGKDLPNQQIGLYFVPHLLYLLLKLYLLAVLIKIPLVLVYHHARLSRKIRIAGLFQSTFPQLIQLIMLVFIFYLFVAGWQANNLRKTIEKQVTGIPLQIPYRSGYQFTPQDSVALGEQIPGFSYPGQIPKNGVVQLQDSFHRSYYFLFYKAGNSADSILFRRIDASFLDKVGNNLTLLAATDLAAYPFHLDQWDSVLYKIRSWGEQSRLNNFHIFPFSLLPFQSSNGFVVPVSEPDSVVKKIQSKITVLETGRPLTIGRVYAPLYDRNFRKIGYWAFDALIQLNLTFFTSPLTRQLLFWLLIYLLINMLLIRRVIKFGNQINQKIVQKFGQLQNGIRHISEGNLNYKIEMEGEDEFVELASRFNQMGEQLDKTVASLREKDRFEHELKIARQVQLSLLPTQLPEIFGYETAAFLKTANEVGGDFYDVLKMGDNRFLLVIGDVSGKSTSAAFYMAQVISLIRYSSQFSDNPAEIISGLNNYFAAQVADRQIFVTAILGVIDAENNSIQLIRAGHNPPVLIPGKRAKKIRELELSGLGIGLERTGNIFKNTLGTKTLKIEGNDTLILYTDGLIEAAHPVAMEDNKQEERREFFGEEHLFDLLQKLRGESAQTIINRITAELDEFYDDHPLVDDYTMLVIKRR